MKFLLVLLVVLFGVWMWRNNRRNDEDEAPPPKPPPKKAEPQAIEMVRCDHCGVHLPSTDVVQGRRGVYCSAKHRGQAES